MNFIHVSQIYSSKHTNRQINRNEFFIIEDFLILDEGSEVLKKQFENHCDWCWVHGFGDCDICKKAFNRVYRPIRIKELTEKYKTMKSEAE